MSVHSIPSLKQLGNSLQSMIPNNNKDLEIRQIFIMDVKANVEQCEPIIIEININESIVLIEDIMNTPLN